jgi:metal-dependent amidase/aminoacylase/carboxypeptidase family protein
MIKEGCLDGVDEVYGYHNIPNFDEGDIRVCEGPFFAKVT